MSLHPDTVVDFREIFLKEPNKELMKQYLEFEHAAQPGQSAQSKRPPRLAKCQYDIIGADKIPEYHESIIDVETRKREKHEVIGKQFHASLTLWEFDHLVKACDESEEFQNILKEFKLPDGFELVIEPWPYGGLDFGAENRRYFQGLCFAQNMKNGNPDSNFYAYPLPIIPVMDAHTRKICRVDRLATGGKGDALTGKTHSERILDHCEQAEYVPELLSGGHVQT